MADRGSDLLVEHVQGTDKIRCTFKVLTDAEIDLHRKSDIPLAALPGDLNPHPLVIKSGNAISITPLPLGKGKIAVVHYLRLTRTDLASDSVQ